MQDFRSLRVWQTAYTVSIEVYRCTREFPAGERYGLVAQMRRAAVSVCANIAEGCGRMTRRELARFLHIAQGSACELECELALAADLGFLPRQDHATLEVSIVQVKRMLGALIRRLRQVDANGVSTNR
jgi:four helix bundle protein